MVQICSNAAQGPCRCTFVFQFIKIAWMEQLNKLLVFMSDYISKRKDLLGEFKRYLKREKKKNSSFDKK